jgi:wyosine [tRNA(Phe)-imidazoG37] synthetase (radical SAM superfamily)
LDAGDGVLFQHVNRPHEWIPFEKMVDGIAEFTSRFRGSVWLEVFLLGGVTGIESEVKKIAALVGRIRPQRTQLNTVERPPAEEFALPLPMKRMRKLAGLFPGPVDIIAAPPRKKQDKSACFEAKTGDILALLRRRPCTPRDIADGLAINVLEVIKHLEALTTAGKAGTVVRGERHFYTATDSQKADADE